MSYPPGQGYGGYPPPSAGYPQHAAYGQPPNPQQPGFGQPPYQQVGYGQQPYQPQSQPSGLGFDNVNQQQPSPGMPTPAPYGQSPYPQPPAQQNPYPQASFGSMAYAASAAVNFRQPAQQSYPQQAQQPYPQQSYPKPPCSQYTQAAYNTTPQNYSTSGVPPTTKTTTSVPQEPATQGTIRDYSSFNPQQDAEILRKAMKGFGTDEKAIIHVIGSRSNAQRQKIKLEFATMFGKDLIKELKSELSGNFESIVLALLMTPAEYDAYQMFNAMEGLGTDEKVLIEILCSRSNRDIKAASDAFKKMYKKDLEKELRSETSGHFRRLLVSLAQGLRLENDPLNQQKAADEARALYQAGEARWGTDESRFNAVFASRSFAQLRLIFEEYGKISKRTIEQAVISEMSGDLKDGMLAMVKCAKDKPSFFAEKLYYSMKGLGTDDKTLIRIMVSRSEVDMVQIKSSFQRMYGKTLANFIADDCSGDYKKLLITICGQ